MYEEKNAALLPMVSQLDPRQYSHRRFGALTAIQRHNRFRSLFDPVVVRSSIVVGDQVPPPAKPSITFPNNPVPKCSSSHEE